MKNFTKRILTVLIFTAVFSSAVNAQTNVSGGIYSNTTWTKANSPYIITDTVVVFPNVILTIEPGVVVKFADTMILEVRQAKLIAIGTSADSITFTSNSVSPVAGIYSGIYLNGGALTSTFNYCNIRYAKIGVNTNVLDSVIVNNSDFYQNVKGLQFFGTGGTQVAKIDSSIFNGNATALDLEKLKSATINYCNFLYNSNYGFFLGTPGDYQSFPSSITYCNFLNNGIGFAWDVLNLNINNCNYSNNNIGVQGPGLMHSYNTHNLTMTSCIFDSNQTGATNLGYMLIANCTIVHNQTGMNIYSGGVIKNCTIDSNTIVGLTSYQDSIVNCDIKYNGKGIQMTFGQIYDSRIEHNALENIVANGTEIANSTIRFSNIGIKDTIGNFGDRITNNIIENNNIGINLNNSISTISCNRICNNTTYDLQYGAIGNVDVSHNYWCTSDSASTEAVIYDGYDNVNYGLVFFMPLDSACAPNVTSVNEIARGSLLFSIFPNPATDYLTVELPANATNKTEIKIFNMLGDIVYSSAATEQKKTNIIDVSTLASGVYLIQVATGSSIMSRRFVRQ